jgi:outer membrane protein OmpA-like peptidoglycan-associated protein
MMIRATLLSSAIALLPLAAAAQSLEFPHSAIRAVEQVDPLASYRLPVGPWKDDRIEAISAEGEVTRQAWQIRTSGMTTLQILSPLRQQLRDMGFEILFECDADACGGFDFRYATDVLPEPQMHVDLGDYRFLSARRMGAEQPEYVSLVVSRSSLKCFVQVMRVGPEQKDTATAFSVSTKTPQPEAVAPPPGPDLMSTPVNTQLEAFGRAVLEDLEFSSGSSELGEGKFQSLDSLASYLLAHPEHSVVLVGHTDAVGGLEGNIALSQRRARSVVRRLVDEFGVSANRVKAQGVGYLAPLASNETAAGRTENRRVEVILTSTR